MHYVKVRINISYDRLGSIISYMALSARPSVHSGPAINITLTQPRMPLQHTTVLRHNPYFPLTQYLAQ